MQKEPANLLTPYQLSLSVYQLRKCRRKPTDKWHLDEVFVTINGHRYYLWRAVDSEGMILDTLLQTRRNAKAAKRFFKQVLHSTPTRPRVIVTDGLRSYNIISRNLLPKVEHRRSKYLNNRAENSHQPTVFFYVFDRDLKQ